MARTTLVRMSTIETQLLLPASRPRDRALVLGVRPADLRRLRDLRARSAFAARITRASRPRPGDQVEAADGAPRPGSRARDRQCAGHQGSDRAQRRGLPRRRSSGCGLNNPGRHHRLLHQHMDPLRARRGARRLVSARDRDVPARNLISTSASTCYALYLIGTPVEQYLGGARYLGLYFVSGLAGSAGALLVQSPNVPILGASGAIFGILGAMLIIEWQVTGRLAGQAMTWIVINLVISFSIPGISWGGHIGGLIGGILITLALRPLEQSRACPVRTARARGHPRPGRRRPSGASRSRTSACTATSER